MKPRDVWTYLSTPDWELCYSKDPQIFQLKETQSLFQTARKVSTSGLNWDLDEKIPAGGNT